MSSTSGWLGMRGTGDWDNDERPTNYRQGILRMSPNGMTSLTGITSMGKSERTDDPQFNWYSKDLATQGGTAAAYSDFALSSAHTTASTAAAGDMVYLKVAEAVANEFRPGHAALVVDSDNQEYDAFGKVTDIVAPNLFHHANITDAHRLFPDAVLWGIPGFQQKRPDIPWQQTLTPESWLYSDQLELFPIDGMPKFNEVVMLHKESRTLVTTDLCFNHIHGRGLGYAIAFRIFGTYRRFAVSRLFMGFVKDRPAMIRSVRNLMGKDFENVIMAHGENVGGDGKERLSTALRERGINL